MSTVLQAEADKLRKNAETIELLDPERFPCLVDLITGHRSSISAKLRRFLLKLEGHCVKQNTPETWNAIHITSAGELYHAASIRWIADGSGSLKTWENMLQLCLDVGLLQRIKPDETSRTAQFKVSSEIGKKYGKRRGVCWYCVPEYTETILKGAEAAAAQYVAKKLRPSNMSKAVVIDVSGQKQANRIFVDGRTKKQAQKLIERELYFRITKTLEAQGYTTKSAVIWATRQAMEKKYLDRPEQERLEVSCAVVRIWDAYHRKILSDAGAVYRRPTKAEKALYGLDGNSWIILPSDK